MALEIDLAKIFIGYGLAPVAQTYPDPEAPKKAKEQALADIKDQAERANKRFVEITDVSVTTGQSYVVVQIIAKVREA